MYSKWYALDINAHLCRPAFRPLPGAPRACSAPAAARRQHQSSFCGLYPQTGKQSFAEDHRGTCLVQDDVAHTLHPLLRCGGHQQAFQASGDSDEDAAGLDIVPACTETMRQVYQAHMCEPSGAFALLQAGTLQGCRSGHQRCAPVVSGEDPRGHVPAAEVLVKLYRAGKAPAVSGNEMEGSTSRAVITATTSGDNYLHWWSSLY